MTTAGGTSLLMAVKPWEGEGGAGGGQQPGQQAESTGRVCDTVGDLMGTGVREWSC